MHWPGAANGDCGFKKPQLSSTDLGQFNPSILSAVVLFPGTRTIDCMRPSGDRHWSWVSPIDKRSEHLFRSSQSSGTSSGHFRFQVHRSPSQMKTEQRWKKQPKGEGELLLSFVDTRNLDAPGCLHLVAQCWVKICLQLFWWVQSSFSWYKPS